LTNLILPEPAPRSLTGSQILGEELWKSKEGKGQSEDSASVASDIRLTIFMCST
jgi:hypothetical protein